MVLGNVIYSQGANQEAAAKFVEFLGGQGSNDNAGRVRN